MIPTDFGIENSNQRKYEEFDFFYHREGGFSSSFIFWKASEVPIVLKINNNASSGCFSDVW